MKKLLFATIFLFAVIGCRKSERYYDVVYSSYNIWANILCDSVMVNCIEYNDKDEVTARHFIENAKDKHRVFKATEKTVKLRFKMTVIGQFIDNGHQENEIKNVFYLTDEDTTFIVLDPEKLEQEKIG